MSETNLPQAVYKRHEIPIAEYLMSFQTALRDEFMGNFEKVPHVLNYFAAPPLDRRGAGVPLDETGYLIQSKNPSTNEYQQNIKGWMAVLFKYRRGEEDSHMDSEVPAYDRRARKFKTAYNLVKEFGEYCPIAQYSVMAPNTVLHRHTGPENRTGKYIRIHIPLIVPEGDLFLEVNGQEVRWDDIFGFNNQFVHSAHNYTNKYRVIFLIDLDREHIGMEPGAPWDERFNELSKLPFVRQTQEINHE